MAAAYVRIYCNEDTEACRVRTFGGNRSKVREKAREYNHMSKERFLKKHPYFTEQCNDRFQIICHVIMKNR